MDRTLPAYLFELDGRLARGWRAVRAPELVHPLGHVVEAFDALPTLDADRVGRVRVRPFGEAAHLWPPEELPTGVIVDEAGRLIVRYLPGLRGSLRETGAIVRPLTLALYRSTLMTTGSPELDTEAALAAWLGSWDGAA